MAATTNFTHFNYFQRMGMKSSACAWNKARNCDIGPHISKFFAQSFVVFEYNLFTGF